MGEGGALVLTAQLLNCALGNAKLGKHCRMGCFVAVEGAQFNPDSTIEKVRSNFLGQGSHFGGKERFLAFGWLIFLPGVYYS